MRKYLPNLTTLWWKLTKPRARYEIKLLQEQLRQAQRKHQKTKHIYAKIRYVTEMDLRGQKVKVQ